jgi:hypothetical protein
MYREIVTYKKKVFIVITTYINAYIGMAMPQFKDGKYENLIEIKHHNEFKKIYKSKKFFLFFSSILTFVLIWLIKFRILKSTELTLLIFVIM